MKRYKTLIPTIILIILSIRTIVFAGSDYDLTLQHLFGVTAAIFCAISFFILRTTYRYFLGSTLILWLINIINLTPEKIWASFNFGDMSISFQPYALLLIILTVILVIPKKNELVVVDSRTTTEIISHEFNEDFGKFKTLYISKSDTDLNEILQDKKFTKAAKEAARQILNDRLLNKGSA